MQGGSNIAARKVQQKRNPTGHRGRQIAGVANDMMAPDLTQLLSLLSSGGRSNRSRIKQFVGPTDSANPSLTYSIRQWSMPFSFSAAV